MATMLTWVVPPIASRCAAARERSMIRPLPWGPRSLIVTSTTLPLRRFVTLARLPKGRRGWAAVSACWSKRWPLAVLLPWNPGPYQDALPTCWPPVTLAAWAGFLPSLPPASAVVGKPRDNAKAIINAMGGKPATLERGNRAWKRGSLRSFKSLPRWMVRARSKILLLKQSVISYF